MPKASELIPRTVGSVRSKKKEAAGTITLGSAIKGLRQGRETSGASSRVSQSPSRSPRLTSRQFALRYFPHHFPSQFCELHDYIFERIDERKGDKRIACIAPRKFGKTTIIDLVLPIRELAYQTKFFVLLIGESADTAEANLATLAHEVETNELLLEDFPHLQPAKDHRGQNIKWTDRQIVFANFATVRAKGMGARMRGMKHRHMRPDLAILDDPESPETADTFLKRQRHKRWFGGTFMGLGAQSWDIYVIGNLPHHDCLIADLVKDSGWEGTLWRAENLPPRENERYPIGNSRSDGSALWPEAWSLEKLARYRKEPNVGDLGYSREMLNDPREEENKAFNIHEFEFIDWTPDLLREYAEMVISVDPAGGEEPGQVKRGKRDYCAVVGMGRRRDNSIDVFAVSLTKKLPDAQIDIVLDMYEWSRAPISVEENMYKNLIQPVMMRRAKERQLYPTIITRKQDQNKVRRILSLQPPIRQRIIRFARHLLEKIPEFFAQFDEFPGTYDDGPDATEGGLRRLEKPLLLGTPSFTSMTKESYWRRKGS